jgi:hypothetical protein
MMSFTCLKSGCNGNIQVDDDYDEFETWDRERMATPLLTEVLKEQ